MLKGILSIGLSNVVCLFCMSVMSNIFFVMSNEVRHLFRFLVAKPLGMTGSGVISSDSEKSRRLLT